VRTLRNTAFGVALVTSAAGCPAPPSPFDFTRFPTGTTPNSVALRTCDGVRTAVVAVSGGARVDAIALDTALDTDLDDADASAADQNAADQNAAGVAFEPGASPWTIVPFRDGALVTLFGSHEVAFVDPCTGEVHSRAGADDDVDVEPAVFPRSPIDADLDGALDPRVVRMRPRHPEGLAVDDDGHVWVSFTNIIDVALPGDGEMQAGPGVLARFVVDDDGVISFVEQRILPCQNPQGVAVSGDRVVVSCSGRFRYSSDGARFERASEGGLVVFATADFAVVASATFALSFGTPVFAGEDIIVGSVLGGSIFRLDPGLAIIDDRAIGGRDESLFKVVLVDEEAAVTRFVNGDLVLDPFGIGLVVPFTDPRQPPRGLVDVVIDDGAREAIGVLSLSGEVGKVRLP